MITMWGCVTNFMAKSYLVNLVHHGLNTNRQNFKNLCCGRMLVVQYGVEVSLLFYRPPPPSLGGLDLKNRKG